MPETSSTTIQPHLVFHFDAQGRIAPRSYFPGGKAVNPRCSKFAVVCRSSVQIVNAEQFLSSSGLGRRLLFPMVNSSDDFSGQQSGGLLCMSECSTKGFPPQ